MLKRVKVKSNMNYWCHILQNRLYTICTKPIFLPINQIGKLNQSNIIEAIYTETEDSLFLLANLSKR